MSGTTEQRFWEFHLANPAVYEGLTELALKAHGKGRSKLGINMLFEVLRWDRYMNTTDPDFKLNNNYAPYYSRLIMLCNPQLDGMFELREIRAA